MRTKEDVQDDIKRTNDAIDISVRYINGIRNQISTLESAIISENENIAKMNNCLDSLHTELDDFNQNTH